MLATVVLPGCLFYGVFGKVGAFFTSIPSPVLGGMSTFLFANIAVSGLQVMTTHAVDRQSVWNRILPPCPYKETTLPYKETTARQEVQHGCYYLASLLVDSQRRDHSLSLERLTS